MANCEDHRDVIANELKRQGNTNKNTVISKLPNEVLLEIFAVLKHTQLLRSWHQITHVCRHWRYVALEAATLWADPPTDLHDYTVVMLKRSRNSLLDIRIPNRTPTDTSAVMLREIWRIKSLFVYQRKAGLDHMQSTLSGLGRAASQLQVLKIIQISPHGDSTFKLSATTFHDPTSLRQIHFVAIDLDWQIFPIRSLTRLSLERIRISNPPTWIQFQNALRAMPLLEQLSFSFDELQLNSPYPICPEPLQMPLLRRLTIDSGLASTVEGFISHTKFPLLRHACITCEPRSNSDDDDHRAVISAFLSLLTKGDFGCHDCLALGKSHHMVTKIDHLHHSYTQEVEFSPALWITIQGATRVAQGTAAAIMNLPDIASQLTHLVLPTTALNSDQLHDIVGLRVLSLTTYAYSPLIHTLAIPPTTLPDEPIAFPALETLILLAVDPSDEDVDEAALLDQLRDCLLSRRAHGSGVSTLCLAWDVIYEDVRRLREIVDLVQCKAYRKEPADEDAREEVIANGSPSLAEGLIDDHE